MKKLVISSLKILIVPFTILFAVNTYVDPAHIFNNRRFLQHCLNILFSKQNVANVTNYDERLFQKYYIDRLRAKLNIIVIGSSRSMQIGSELFPGYSFFNNSVSGCVIQDYLSIYNVYDNRKITPDIIILGMDPWVLNPSFQDSRWKSLSADYFKMSDKIGLHYNKITLDRFENIKYFLIKIKEFFSFKYFQESVKQFNKNSIYPTTLRVSNSTIKYFDGSLYEYKYEQRSINEVRKLAESYNYDSPATFKNLDREKKEILIFFIKHLKHQGVIIKFFICPYHPVTFQKFIRRNRSYSEFLTFITILASEFDIQIIGALDPAIFQLDEKAFYDGMHLNREATRKIICSEILLPKIPHTFKK